MTFYYEVNSVPDVRFRSRKAEFKMFLKVAMMFEGE